LPLFLIKHDTINVNEGVEVKLHAFLNLSPDEGEWSASQSGRFTLHLPNLYWIRGLVGPGVGRNPAAKIKIAAPVVNRTLVVQFVVGYCAKTIRSLPM
jgi:hypothetical protein